MVRFVCFFLATAILSLPATVFADGATIEANNGLKVKLYGTLRADSIFNDARLDHPQFPNYVLPRAAGEDKRNEFLVHPRLTRLGLDVSGEKLSELVTLEGKLEIDFHNGGSESRQAVRMRHAYAKVQGHGFYGLFGQTWHLVSQLYPSANADSLMWNAGNAGDRAPQVRGGYRGAVGGGDIDLAIAAVMPNAVDRKDLDADGTFDGQDAAVPAVHARVAFGSPTWTKAPLMAAIGGLFARETVENEAMGLNDAFHSLGLFAELELPITDTLALRGEAFVGQNLADVRGGVAQGVNVSEGTEIPTAGFWAELKASLTPMLTVAGGYGHDNPRNRDLEDGNRSLNHALWVTTSIKLSGEMLVGVELIHWMTKLKGNEITYDANRFNAYVAYSF